VKMQADNNCLHRLSVPNRYLLSTYADAEAVIKTHYPHIHIHITVLGYNRIHIPFINNIYYTYLIKFTKIRSF
jgi:hypothetical protein